MILELILSIMLLCDLCDTPSNGSDQDLMRCRLRPLSHEHLHSGVKNFPYPLQPTGSIIPLLVSGGFLIAGEIV